MMLALFVVLGVVLVTGLIAIPVIKEAQAVPSVQINRASVDPNFADSGYAIGNGRPNWFDQITFEFTATSSRQITSYLCGYKLIQNGAPSSSPLYPVLSDSNYQTCSSSGLRIITPQMLPNNRDAVGRYTLSNVPLPAISGIPYKFCIKARDIDGNSAPQCWLWSPQMVKTPLVSGYSDSDSVFRSGAVIRASNIRLTFGYLGWDVFPGQPYYMCSYDQSFHLQPPAGSWVRCGTPFPLYSGDPRPASTQYITGLSATWHSVWVRAHLPGSYPGNPTMFTFCYTRFEPLPADVCSGQPPSSIPMSSRIGSGGGVPAMLEQIKDQFGKEPMQPIPLPPGQGNFTDDIKQAPTDPDDIKQAPTDPDDIKQAPD